METSDDTCQSEHTTTPNELKFIEDINNSSTFEGWGLFDWLDFGLETCSQVMASLILDWSFQMGTHFLWSWMIGWPQLLSFVIFAVLRPLKFMSPEKQVSMGHLGLASGLISLVLALSEFFFQALVIHRQFLSSAALARDDLGVAFLLHFQQHMLSSFGLTLFCIFAYYRFNTRLNQPMLDVKEHSS